MHIATLYRQNEIFLPHVLLTRRVSAHVIKNCSHLSIYVEVLFCGTAQESVLSSDASSGRTWGDQRGHLMPPSSPASPCLGASFPLDMSETPPWGRRLRRERAWLEICANKEKLIHHLLPNRSDSSFLTISSCGRHVVTWLSSNSKSSYRQTLNVTFHP